MALGLNNYGWVPFDERTPEQNRLHAAAVAEMPRFHIVGRTNYEKGKSLLFNLWKHPKVVAALGMEFTGVHQLTGSCVGAGGGNMAFTLNAGDALLRNEPQEIIVPFWPLPYGRSRFYLGDRSPGEGSSGSTFAKAAREDGFLDAKLSGLPTFKNTDGLIWGKEVELAWSDGDAQQTLDLLPESRKHLVKTAAEARSADEVRDGIVNGYPGTCASMWGMADGQWKGRLSGTPQVLLGIRTGRWAHQMSIQAWWDHPTLGEIFWIQNQWGLNPHGVCPTGAPRGGFWITKAEMDWICRNGEVYIFSGYDGYPAREVDWDFEANWLI